MITATILNEFGDKFDGDLFLSLIVINHLILVSKIYIDKSKGKIKKQPVQLISWYAPKFSQNFPSISKQEIIKTKIEVKIAS